MSTISVALLQMNSCGTDQEANLAKGEVFCRKAREMGADIALFPEMWNIGYTSFVDTQKSPSDLWRAPGRWNDADARDPLSREEARARWQERAIGRDVPFIAHYRALAEELGMAIVITYLEKWDGAPRNSVSLIDRRGEILMT
jgi:N-carbamoylputrescine amidase